MAFSAVYDVVIDERDVRIYSNGSGPPVLMLHDLGSSAATWESLTGPVVEAGRQLVAVDLPGAGHSDAVPGSELGAFVDHLRRVIEQLTSAPIDVVGHGFGAYLAASVAARDPQLVSGLVLEDPTLPPRSGPPVSSRMAPGMALSGAVTTLRRGRIKQNIGGFARAKAVLEQLAKSDPAWWGALSQITAPTLIVGTGPAEAAERAQLDLLSTAIPTATRTVLVPSKRAHASDPEAFAEAIAPILSGGR